MGLSENGIYPKCFFLIGNIMTKQGIYGYTVFQTKPYPPYTPLWDFADASSFSIGTIEPVGCDGNLSDPGRER